MLVEKKNDIDSVHTSCDPELSLGAMVSNKIILARIMMLLLKTLNFCGIV